MDVETFFPLWRAGALGLGLALKRVFPEVNLREGGAWELGYYQEFYLDSPLSEEMLAPIEEALRGVVKEDFPLTHLTMIAKNAQEYLHHHGQEGLARELEGLGNRLVEIGRLETLFDWVGGDLPASTSAVGVVKLTRLSPLGASGHYRLEGTSAPHKQALKGLLKQIEEAQSRDHRRIGEEMKLWGPGGGWGPNGLVVRDQLWSWWKEAASELGALLIDREEVWNGKKSLESAHRDAQKQWGAQGIGEWVVCRKEESEARVGWLDRVGQRADLFHFFPEAADRPPFLISSLQFIVRTIKMFGFDHRLILSGKGVPARRLAEAVQAVGVAVEEGHALEPFTGAVLEVWVQDGRLRPWATSRLGLSPQGGVFISLLCSVERTLALLLERRATTLPLWLAPEQVRLIALTAKADEACSLMAREWGESGLRVRQQRLTGPLGTAVYDAQKERVPYILVIGDREAAKGTFSVRLSSGETLKGVSREEFQQALIQEVKEKALTGKMVARREIRA